MWATVAHLGNSFTLETVTRKHCIGDIMGNARELIASLSGLLATQSWLSAGFHFVSLVPRGLHRHMCACQAAVPISGSENMVTAITELPTVRKWASARKLFIAWWEDLFSTK